MPHIKVSFLLFWGSAEDRGSLSSLKELVNRKGVDVQAKTFEASDEFLHHTLEAHLTASLLQFLDIVDTSQVPASAGGQPSQSWLEKTAASFVHRVVGIPTDSHTHEADNVYNQHRSFLHAALLYSDLRNAVRCEDGPRIISQWRWWLPYFLATNRKNYSQEAANLLANLSADFSPRMAYIATHNRTVNTTGRPGKGKPIDMAIEHHNLVLKNALRSAGANVTLHHLKVISLPSQLVHEAALKCDSEFHTPRTSSHHTVADPKTDVEMMPAASVNAEVAKQVRAVNCLAMKTILHHWK